MPPTGWSPRCARAAGCRCSGGIRCRSHEAQDLQFLQRETLTRHPNGIRFRALDAAGAELLLEYYYSVGGGFVLSEREADAGPARCVERRPAVPVRARRRSCWPCAATHGRPIAELILANEKSWRDEAEIRAGLLAIWAAMEGSIERGCRTPGTLPGGLKVRRRAPAMHDELTRRPEAGLRDQLTVLDWVNLYALAVNEENAAGGRVVTAPTNGAAGVIPAVLAYYTRFVPGADEDGIVRFLLTAAAIGMLYKENASISAAEVGCQGEVGVACSMAAAGLCAVLGGSDEQVENAAEIGMEHNLGLTCDPIGGLVQIPCIERNTMGAVKAINAARLALHGDGSHHRPARQGDRDHAPDRARHDGQVQGDVAGRARGQRGRVLSGARRWSCCVIVVALLADRLQLAMARARKDEAGESARSLAFINATIPGNA